MSGASVLFDAPGTARPGAQPSDHPSVTIVRRGGWWCGWCTRGWSAKGQLTAAKWEPFLTANLWKTYVLARHPGHVDCGGGVDRAGAGPRVPSRCRPAVPPQRRAVAVLGDRRVLPRRAGADHDDLRVLPVSRTTTSFPSKHLALAGVITGLTLYNGAVIAEIVRAGVNALPRGQSEAAAALGLRWGQIMRSILLPQAITSMLPVLVSQMVVVLKDTAIGYQITFLEMVRQGTTGRIGVRQLHSRPDRDRALDDHA